MFLNSDSIDEFNSKSLNKVIVYILNNNLIKMVFHNKCELPVLKLWSCEKYNWNSFIYTL